MISNDQDEPFVPADATITAKPTTTTSTPPALAWTADMTNWNGDAYQWDGTYTIRAYRRSGNGLPDACDATDLGVVKKTTTPAVLNSDGTVKTPAVYAYSLGLFDPTIPNSVDSTTGN